MATRMRVTVTGGAGFVGSAVCRALIASGHEVRAVDTLSTGRRENVPDGVVLEQRDAGTADYAGADAVVHCAAVADISRNWDSLAEREAVWRAGPELTWRVLERVPAGVRFVFVSSCAVYGAGADQPPYAGSIYAASKLAAEALVCAHSEAGRVQGSIMRLASAVGTNYWHGHLADFVRQALTVGEVRARDDGSQRKSFVHVDDVGHMVTTDLTLGRGSLIDVGRDLWSWRDTIDVMRETRPVEVTWDAVRSAWVGDPIDLRVRGYHSRSVPDGVRAALVSLGWRRSVDDARAP